MKNTLILVLSMGWIAPLLLICYLLIAYLKNQEQQNSFPYLPTLDILLMITTAWFAIVIISLGFYFFKH